MNENPKTDAGPLSKGGGNDRNLNLKGLIDETAVKMAPILENEGKNHLALGKLAYEFDLAITGGEKAKAGEDAFRALAGRIKEINKKFIDPKRLRDFAQYWEMRQKMDGASRFPSLGLSHYLAVQTSWLKSEDRERILAEAETRDLTVPQVREMVQEVAYDPERLAAKRAAQHDPLSLLMTVEASKIQAAAFAAIEAGKLTEIHRERARSLIAVLYMAFFGGGNAAVDRACGEPSPIQESEAEALKAA